METRQSNSEISSDANGSCESSMLYTSFRFSDSKTDLQNFDFENDLKKYLKIKAAFLRSLVHDSGVRNDEKPDISTSIRELNISSEDCLEKPVDEHIEDVNPQENQNDESDHSQVQTHHSASDHSADELAITHESSEDEVSHHSQYDGNLANLGFIPPPTQETVDVQHVEEDSLPEEPINLHRNTFRWNRQHYLADQINVSPEEQSSSKSCEPSFTEIVMKAFIAGRLLFGALKKRRNVLNKKRQKIADSLFKEEAETNMIAFVDPSSLAMDVRPMVPITANTLHKDRSLFNAAKRHTSQRSIIEPSSNGCKNIIPTNVGQKLSESESKVAQLKTEIKEQPQANETNKEKRKNKKDMSSSSDEDIEELERLSEARLGRRK